MAQPIKPITDARTLAERLGILPWYGSGFGPVVPPAFTPTVLPELRLWLDGDDLTTVTHAAGAVTQWDSKDPLARAFVQGVAASQPATGVHTLNGRNVITFAEDFLASNAAASAWNFLHDGTEYDLYAVMNFTDTLFAGLIGTNGGAATNNGATIYRTTNQRVGGLVTRGATGAVVQYTSPNDWFASNGFALLSVRMRPGSGTPAQRIQLLRNNGSSLAANTESAAPSVGDAFAPLQIGGIGNGGALLSAQVAELIVCGRLDAPTQAELHGYITTKWGTVIA